MAEYTRDDYERTLADLDREYGFILDGGSSPIVKDALRLAASMKRPERINTRELAQRFSLAATLPDAGASFHLSREDMATIADALAASGGVPEGWRFDVEAAPVLTPVLIAIEMYHNKKRIVGEAYYRVDTHQWWWANQNDGDYHADAASNEGRVYAWQPLPPAPKEAGQ